MTKERSDTEIWLAIVNGGGHLHRAARAARMSYVAFINRISDIDTFRRVEKLISHAMDLDCACNKCVVRVQVARWQFEGHKPTRQQLAKLIFGTETPVL